MQDRVTDAIDAGITRLNELEREVTGVGQAWSTPMLRLTRAVKAVFEEIASERHAEQQQMTLPTERPD